MSCARLWGDRAVLSLVDLNVLFLLLLDLVSYVLRQLQRLGLDQERILLAQLFDSPTHNSLLFVEERHMLWPF